MFSLSCINFLFPRPPGCSPAVGRFISCRKPAQAGRVTAARMNSRVLAITFASRGYPSEPGVAAKTRIACDIEYACPDYNQPLIKKMPYPPFREPLPTYRSLIHQTTEFPRRKG